MTTYAPTDPILDEIQPPEITGTEGDDRLTDENVPSSWGPLRIYAGDGDDSILAIRSETDVRGGAGNDTITAGGFAQVVIGGTGADRIVLTPDHSMTTIHYTSVHDSTVDAPDTIRGAGYDDIVDISHLLNDVDGPVHVQYYFRKGTDGSQIAKGFDVDIGDDGIVDMRIVLEGSTAPSIGFGGGQVLTTGTTLLSASEPDLIPTTFLTSGNDVYEGAAGSQNIRAGAGDDRITFDRADGIVDGGAGNDTLVLTKSAIVLLGSPLGQVQGSGHVVGFENVDASASNAGVTLIGSDGVNVLTGSNYADLIEGGAGADRLYGGGGNDDIVYDADDTHVSGGDKGADTLVLTTGETVDLSNGSDQVVGGGKTWGFEAVNAGDASASVTLKGDAWANTLVGSRFADTIDGGDGNDTIDGGAGIDKLEGGAGNDRITYDASDRIVSGGDKGRDVLVLTTAETVDLSNGSDQVVGGGKAYGFEIVDGTNASGALNLKGDAWGNDLYGSAFNDTIDGGAGNDRLEGGAGNDRIVYDAADRTVNGGDKGNDTLVLRTAETVDLSVGSDQVVGGGKVYGFEAVDASAASGASSLTGDRWGNTITGSAYDDTIAGGEGRDVLKGGAGSDTFVLSSRTAGSEDRILDFSSEDVVRLDHTVFGLSKGAGITSEGTLDAAWFGAPGASSNHAMFLFDDASGRLSFEASKGSTVLLATFEGGASITASDFTFGDGWLVS